MKYYKLTAIISGLVLLILIFLIPNINSYGRWAHYFCGGCCEFCYADCRLRLGFPYPYYYAGYNSGSWVSFFNPLFFLYNMIFCLVSEFSIILTYLLITRYLQSLPSPPETMKKVYMIEMLIGVCVMYIFFSYIAVFHFFNPVNNSINVILGLLIIALEILFGLLGYRFSLTRWKKKESENKSL